MKKRYCSFGIMMFFIIIGLAPIHAQESSVRNEVDKPKLRKPPYTITYFNIQIFPNPTMDDLKILATEEIISKVNIYDVNGRMVYKEAWEMLQEEVKLSLSFLPKGLYFLEAYMEGEDRILEKIVVQ